MVGMAIAVVTTLTVDRTTSAYILLAICRRRGAVGAVVAKRIEMTTMPELVAAMHSLVGLAAVLIAMAAFNNPVAYGICPAGETLHLSNRIELFIGTFVGAITFYGLGHRVRQAVRQTGQQAACALPASTGSTWRWHRDDRLWHRLQHGAGLDAVPDHDGHRLVLGVLLIIPIGGADMPVVVSMLNSYSGWAAAGIGFTLDNTMLIIAGSLVGRSGAILSYIMCKAMNRVVLQRDPGRLCGGEGAVADAGDGVQKTYRSGSADDAAFLMGNAETA